MGVRILIVDDEPFMRLKLKDLLEREGFEVCGEAENGQDAIDKYKVLKPDLVTMDIVMPKVKEIDGIGAVKEIIKIDPDAKIVMLTAIGQHDFIVESIRSGAKDFVVKAANPLRIIKVIEKILKESEQENNGESP